MPDMFQFVGVSQYKGEYKVRFANSASRAKILERYGHSDVRMVDLGLPMAKASAVLAIEHLDVFSDLEAQTAIAEFLAVDEERATRGLKAAVSKSTREPRSRRKNVEGVDPDDDILAMARAVAARESNDSQVNFVTETIDPDDEILALARAVAARERELVVVDDEDEPF